MADFDNFRFHDLRHTAATLMVMGGMDLVTVKEILGHSRIEMTMRYGSPDIGKQKKGSCCPGINFQEKSSHKSVIRGKID